MTLYLMIFIFKNNISIGSSQNPQFVIIVTRFNQENTICYSKNNINLNKYIFLTKAIIFNVDKIQYHTEVFIIEKQFSAHILK